MSALKKIKDFMSSQAMIFAYLVCYMIVGFGTISPFLCGQPFFNLYCNAVKFFGLIILFFCVFNKKLWKFDLCFTLMLVFLASYLGSCFISMNYGGLWNNVKGILWLLLQVILLAGLLNDGIKSKWLPRLLLLFVCIATIYSAISVEILLVGYIYVPSLAGTDTLWLGLCSGRLYGFYKDPNYAAITACICLYALIFLNIKKRSKALLILSIILAIPQIIVISLSGSRTALVSIIASVFVFIFVLSLKFMQKKNKAKVVMVLMALVSSFVICGVVGVVIFGTSSIYDKVGPKVLEIQGGPLGDSIHIYTRDMANRLNGDLGLAQLGDNEQKQALQGTDKDANTNSRAISGVEIIDTDQNSEASLQSNSAAAGTSAAHGNSSADDGVAGANNGSADDGAAGESSSSNSGSTSNNGINDTTNNIQSEHSGLMARDESADISNNRFALWKNAIKLWLQSPIIGVSHYNILNYSKALFPEDKYAQMNQITSHNAFLDILAAQGIIGLASFIGIIVLTFIEFVKLLTKTKGQHAYLICTILGIFVFILATSMFYPELVYINTLDALFFWYIISLVRSECLIRIK